MGFAAAWASGQRGLDQMMAAASAADAEGVIDLALGDPDLDTDPRVIDAAFADAKRGYTHYAPARGDADLLAKIRGVWQEDLGVRVDEDELMVTASGCHAMWLLLSAVLDPGDEVAVFPPYFPPYPEQIRLAGGVPVEVPCDARYGFVPQAAALEKAVTGRTKAVIVNSPCNPTGAILSAHDLEALLVVCEKRGLLLIADDIYTSYAFDRPFVAAATLPGARGKHATIRSFSKDFCMSGWRLGYVVAPPDVVSAMLAINESNVYVAPTVSQRAALHALGLRHDIAERVHRCYQARMDYVAGRIAEIPYLGLPSTHGSLYAFVDIAASGETSASFCAKLLEKHRVSAIPGTAFGQAGEGFVRLALREDIPVLSKVFDALAHDGEWAG